MKRAKCNFEYTNSREVPKVINRPAILFINDVLEIYSSGYFGFVCSKSNHSAVLQLRSLVSNYLYTFQMKNAVFMIGEYVW